MARFWTSGTSTRGTDRNFGAMESVHVRGWDSGVRVMTGSGKTDSFTVIMTTGTNAKGGNKVLGEVIDTPDGPRFEMTDEAFAAESERRKAQDEDAPFYTLTSEDVGKATIKAFGRTWHTSTFIGKVLGPKDGHPGDVGKRVVKVGTGLDAHLQVENDSQFYARKRAEGREAVIAAGNRAEAERQAYFPREAVDRELAKHGADPLTDEEAADAFLHDVTEGVAGFGLEPRPVPHCRTHLEFRSDCDACVTEREHSA